MRKISLTAVIFVLTLLSIQNKSSAQCAWSSLGVDDKEGYISGKTCDLALDNNSIPYVLVESAEDSSKLTLKKYDAGKWVDVGNSLFSPPTSNLKSLVIDKKNNVPFVAFSDASKGDKATVMKCDSGIWKIVGTAGFTEDKATGIRLAMDTFGILYIAYFDEHNSGKVTVKKFDTTWKTVGNAGFSGGRGAYLSIDVSFENVISVAYSDNSQISKTTAKFFDGTTWRTMGAEGFSVSVVSNLNLASSDEGYHYVAYTDNGFGSKATVKQFRGIGWDNVGAQGFTPTVSFYTRLCLDTSNAPVVAYFFDEETYVMAYKGGSWMTMGDVPYAVMPEKIIADKNNRFYIVGQSVNNSQNPVVLTYEGNSWEVLGNKGIAAEQFSDFAIAKNGTPFVGFRQNKKHENEYKVLKFDNGLWEQVGASGTHMKTEYPAMTLDTNGLPYVAYSDLRNSNRMQVNRFNGTSWETVGTAGFTTSSAYFSSIAIASNNTPYVVYRDVDSVHRATVSRYNGTSWEIVGKRAFSHPGVINKQMTIVCDKNNLPWVAYMEVDNKDVYVVRFDGTDWIPVGVGGVADTIIDVFSNSVLSLGVGDTAYVAYKDFKHSGKISVKKFDGNSWVLVGNAGFSKGQINSLAIHTDKSGTPYVVYQDEGEKNRIVARKFVGNNWELVGGDLPSGEINQNAKMAFNAMGETFIAYGGFIHAKKLSDPSINTAVSVTDSTLTVNLAGAKYQWINCDKDGQIVPGATEQVFKPSDSANYAVYITVGDCVEKSACHKLDKKDDGNGIAGLSQNGLSVFPNPANHVLSIKGITQNTTYFIYDFTGRKILSGEIAPTQNQIAVASLADGVYLLKLNTGQLAKIVIAR